MNLFSVDLYRRVADVHQRLLCNQLLMQHVQDLHLLSATIMDSNLINDYLYEDIKELNAVLDLFISVAAVPTMPCGMWAAIP